MAELDSLALIANPVSCGGKGRRGATKVAQLLTEQGVDFTLHWTQARGDAEVMARKAVEEGRRRIVACGGDGTVHEVVNGIMAARAGSKVTLGLVPLGQCNDLGRALAIPRDLPGVVSTLLRGTTRTIDLGQAGDRYFSTVMTLGFDSVVNEFVAGGGVPRFVKGTASYVWAIFAKLFQYTGVWVTMEGDFGRFEGQVFLAATGNTPTYGGRIKIVPPAVIDDGLLNICLVHSVSRFTILSMLPMVFSGRHVNHPAVELKQVYRMEIDAREPISLWADGEFVARTPTTVRVAPRALQVLVPAGGPFQAPRL